MNAESLFLQFRKDREPAPLGALFDLVADELFGVALHLCRNCAEAEDLVQATFLVAIERPERYDAARPLRPWLLGILEQEAKARRRRARRTPDPARLSVPIDSPPVQNVLATETTQEVASAIAKVPQPYRDVLELRLVQILSHGEIQTRLQRSPGVVRTQLWRGLELLRELLPKGLALGLAAELSLEPGLAAVRQRVLSAASGKVGVAGAGVLAGVLLMQKVWIGVAAVAVLVAGWWAWPPRVAEAPQQANVAGASSSAIASPVPVADAVREQDVDRTLVAPPRPPIEQPANAAPTAPVSVCAVVVDANGNPVADAEVALHAALPSKEQNGRARPSDQRLPGPPFWRANTDVSGRAEFTLDREAFVAAHKDGAGMTGDLRVEPRMRELQQELRLVLRPAVRVTGTVRMPGGEPAAGASVKVWKSSYAEWNRAEAPPAVVTGEDGRFGFVVVAGFDWHFRANLAKCYSAHVTVATEPVANDQHITLQLPGAFSVRGVLLGADGKPTAGEVRLVSDPARLGHDPHYTLTKPDSTGRFELLLSEGGRFELVGGVEGLTADHVPIVLDAVRPHQEVTLRLTPFVVVAGRVVDERGNSCADVFVGLSPAGERTNLLSCLMSVEGIMPRGPTAADGTFRFLAPARGSYRLGYRPAPQLYVQGPEVAAPTEDALLIVREIDKQGFFVAGRVIVDATGAVVPKFRVFLVTHEPSGGASDTPLATGSDGTFAVGPLPTGERYTLRIEAEGFGDVDLGPFDATVRREEVIARMPALGSLLCTVLRADGTPAVKAHVGIERQGSHPFAGTPQGATDHEGRIRFADLTPDDYRVGVRSAVGVADGAKATGSATIVPGQQSAIVLMLSK